MTFNNKFDYSLDLDGMQQDLNRVDRKPGQTDRSDKYLQLPKGEGSVTVRILPAVKPNSQGLKVPYAATRLHYINSRSYHCFCELEEGKWRNKGECPVCNYYNFLYKEAREADSKELADALTSKARQLKPIERYYYNVIIRELIDDDGTKLSNVGPRIASFGKSQQARILRAFLGNLKMKEKPLGNVAHPFTGRDFKINKEIRKSEFGDFPNYDSSKFLDESVAGSEDEIDQWIGNLWDLEAERLDDIKSTGELEHQVNIFRGVEEDDSVTFDRSQYDVPTDIQTRNSSATVATSETSTVTEQPVAVTVPVDEEPPFDTNPTSADVSKEIGDVAMVEEDWVKDLKKVVEKASI